MLIDLFMCCIIVDIVAFFQVLDFLCLLGGVFWRCVPGLVHLWRPMGTRRPGMVGARCLLLASCNVDARARAQRWRRRRRRAGPGPQTRAAVGCGGRRSCTHQLARTRLPPSGVAASLHPTGRRAGSGAEVWAGPASLAPGTPTGPVRPEQSAGGGEERERRCTEGELGTQGWRVSMRCGPPPHSHAGWTEG